MTKTTFAPVLRLLPLVVLALSACSNIQSSRDVSDSTVAGKTIAVQVCSACHGVTGESTSPMFPKLAGQRKDYLATQLADFKGHDRRDSRGAEYMWGFTHLTVKQVDELADYFAAQSPMKGRKSGTVLARGQEIFDKGVPEKGVVQCSACHGPGGEGNEGFPRLAGQHSNYLLEQIKVFQLTDKRPRGAAMKQITHELSESDAMAVAQYIESIGASR